MTTIVDLRTQVLSVPLHTPFVTALRRTTTTETVLLRLTDSDGVTGWGEAPQVWQVTGDSLAGSAACLEGPLRDLLVGARLDVDDPTDPGDLAELTARVQRAVVGNRAAKMAADVALHDLAARRSGVPLHQHLATLPRVVRNILPPPDAPPGRERCALPVTAGAEGGVRTDVTLAAGDARELARAATARVGDGFGVLKLKVGTDPATDVARVRAVREAVGPDVVLRLDANQGWDAFEAVRVVGELEDAGLGVELVEQPVPAHDVLGLAHVTAHVHTPVMADESVFDLVDLVEVLRSRAADLVNVKLAKCGGLTPALELLAVARRHDVGTCVGSMMESAVGIGAAAGLAAAVGTSVVNDLDAAWWAAASPFAGGIAYDADRVVLSDAPGLGIDAIEGSLR